MSQVPGRDDVRAVLAEFDRCFAAGDADALAELFAEDAQLLLQHQAQIEGRAAIRAHWTQLFAKLDTGAWRTEHRIVDEHGNHAYVLLVYTETLVPRSGGPSLSVSGRLILFLRRESGGPWRVAVAMNSHVRPVEEVP